MSADLPDFEALQAQIAERDAEIARLRERLTKMMEATE
jgi:hypothetical protein